mmetsp:Transcript_8141/g.16414  ORF Transcript_8141/g.16414 Transcript_8141/m.16414 type:complete len:103 (-) Transcript_8141:2404-2712(-)
MYVANTSPRRLNPTQNFSLTINAPSDSIHDFHVYLLRDLDGSAGISPYVQATSTRATKGRWLGGHKAFVKPSLKRRRLCFSKRISESFPKDLLQILPRYLPR